MQPIASLARQRGKELALRPLAARIASSSSRLLPRNSQRFSGSEPVSWNPQSGYKYGTPPSNRTKPESWEYVWYPYLAFLTAIFIAKAVFYPTEDPLKRVEAETIQRLKDSGTYPTYEPIRPEGQVPKGMPADPIYS